MIWRDGLDILFHHNEFLKHAKYVVLKRRKITKDYNVIFDYILFKYIQILNDLVKYTR